MPLLKSIGYLYRNPEISSDIFDLFYKMEKESREEQPFCEPMIGCYMNQLFFLLARNKNCYDDTRVSKEYIEGAIAYVQNHFTDVDLSLGKTAELFSVSPEHFSREFKKETGFGFCEYVNLLRIKKSETLLKTCPDISVTEISSQCGFNDSNYFSEKFKRFYGISPIKYKKMQ
jgi:two-component system response regulator YesN